MAVDNLPEFLHSTNKTDFLLTFCFHSLYSISLYHYSSFTLASCHRKVHKLEPLWRVTYFVSRNVFTVACLHPEKKKKSLLSLSSQETLPAKCELHVVPTSWSQEPQNSRTHKTTYSVLLCPDTGIYEPQMEDEAGIKPAKTTLSVRSACHG